MRYKHCINIGVEWWRVGGRMLTGGCGRLRVWSKGGWPSFGCKYQCAKQVLSRDELTSESASVVAGKGVMANVRGRFEKRPDGQVVFITRVEEGARPSREEGGGRPIRQQEGGGGTRQVLEPDWIPQTLVIVLHKEAVNQYPGMAYYEGVFSGRELSVRAINFGPDPPFPVRATLDVAGFWSLRGFLRFLLVHLVLACFRQCFGYQ